MYWQQQAYSRDIYAKGYLEYINRRSLAIKKQDYRRRKSWQFRIKRRNLREKMGPASKNKNRQAAAKKRVRDPNGKFQGCEGNV